VYEDHRGQIWVSGVGGLIKREGDKFSAVLGTKYLTGNIIASIAETSSGLWIAGTKGPILLRPDGSTRWYTTRDGLPNDFVRALCADRSGNLWVGTFGGLSRLENGRFTATKGNPGDRDWIGSLYEDREGDLWVGASSALIRLRDDRFSMYGAPEGFPSDEPTALHLDRRGELWVGYHASGLVALGADGLRAYTTRDGLPSNEIFSIEESAHGDLLIGSSGGLSRMRAGRFINYSVPDPAGRKSVYHALEDADGRLWAATSSGVYEFDGKGWRGVIQGHASASDFVLTLTMGQDGALWAGTMSNGLWQITDGKTHAVRPRLFTPADGAQSNQIRSLYQDPAGTLWIATAGGGLSAFRAGVFRRYTARDGLLSDNISHVQDDGLGRLWLSTTRGISSVSIQQLRDFSAGKIGRLTPDNYGVSDGLRSAQCAPSFPAGGGSARTPDGRLWFTTARGLASIDPRDPAQDAARSAAPPVLHISEMEVDGRPVGLDRAARLAPGAARIQFRYAGIHLSSPERLRYSYELAGLDRVWIPAGSRRVAEYSHLPHGRYRFLVRSEVPGGGASQSEFAFQVLPRFFETPWFLALCALSVVCGAYGMHRLRLKRIHSRFALVFEERSRLAREIHDTLAQGFVGISHQLDALAIKLGGDLDIAREHLNLARKMARHSLTEARRSVMDLRTSDLEGRDLSTALGTSARLWAAGSAVQVRVETSGSRRELSSDLEQNILRIAQEAVANSLKHAHAQTIWIDLSIEASLLQLRVKDDGQGFEPPDGFSLAGGHFGLLGMQERAERLGGKLALASQPGSGTEVEVTVPLGSKHSRLL
jgi:ligand-binding sensor domain-containing protein/two-component sensor histidine kinase